MAPSAPPPATRFTNDVAAKQTAKSAPAARKMAPKVATGMSSSPAPAMPLPTGLVVGSKIAPTGAAGPKTSPTAAPKAVMPGNEQSDFVADGQRIERGRASCTPVAPIGSGRAPASAVPATTAAIASPVATGGTGAHAKPSTPQPVAIALTEEAAAAVACSADSSAPTVAAAAVMAQAVAAAAAAAAVVRGSTGHAADKEAHAEAEGDDTEEGSAIVAEADDDRKTAAAPPGESSGGLDDVQASEALARRRPGLQLPPATLLLRTLQLNDEDLTRLLRTALRARPWLEDPVEQALSSLKDPGCPAEGKMTTAVQMQ